MERVAAVVQLGKSSTELPKMTRTIKHENAKITCSCQWCNPARARAEYFLWSFSKISKQEREKRDFRDAKKNAYKNLFKGIS